MRIAQIAPLIERVPPKKYGGTERVIYTLTEELVRRGHDVTLFASGDSVTSARLVPSHPKPLREARIANLYGPNMWTLLNIGRAYAMQDEFDVIHDHTMPLSLPTANISRTPVIGTNHGSLTETGSDVSLGAFLRKPSIVSISRSQMKLTPHLNHAGVVYNGLKMEQYPFGKTHKGYLLYVGRICRDKGTHAAVQTALSLNLPLIIAAKVDTVDQAYFRTHVKPYLSDTIRWIGEVEEQERNALMSEAMCFLHPVTWDEPFGLTLIEAMACGAPVVAFRRGSIPEIIVHGTTGYVVDGVAGMVEAVKNVATIDRSTCRTYALQNFNERTMTDGYERVYRAVRARSYISVRTPVTR